MTIPASIFEDSGASPAAGQVLRFRQGTLTPVVFSLVNPDGTTLNTADSTDAMLYLRERPEDAAFVTLAGTVASGAVTFTPTSRTLFDKSGLCLGVVSILDQAGDPVEMLEVFSEVRPDLTVTSTQRPLTLDYLRHQLQDRCAQDNLFTGELEFQDADLAASVFRALSWWQETVPEDSELVSVTAMDFPGISHLATGAIGQLYILRGAAMQRNRSAVQGGGLQSDDLKRAELYLTLGNSMLQEFHNWATAKFVKVNFSQFCGYSENPLFGSSSGLFADEDYPQT